MDYSIASVERVLMHSLICWSAKKCLPQCCIALLVSDHAVTHLVRCTSSSLEKQGAILQHARAVFVHEVS